MTDITSDNQKLTNEQQNFENVSNKAPDSQSSSTTNEPEKLTDTIPSDLNASEINNEPTTFNNHHKPEEPVPMDGVSNVNNEEGSTTLPNTSTTDFDTSNEVINESQSSESNQTKEETKINVNSDDQQAEAPIKSNQSKDPNEVLNDDDADITSGHDKHTKKTKVDTSVSDNSVTNMDDSSSSNNQNKNEKNQDDQFSSNQHDSSKKSKPHKIPSHDEFGRRTDLNIGYYLGEPDFLESVFANATNKKLIDRLLGCVYGQALGDAYGLSTEFEDQNRVKYNYPDTTEIIPFPDYKLTGHNRRWPRGDWTDDTDQWILILDTLVNYNGDEKVFAEKLYNWIRYGYKELGDHGGMGLGANVSQVVRSSDYLENPFAASERVWERSNRQAAPNGAVMRCSASAFVHFNDPEKVKATAISMCKTTHFDPRCIASCLAVCLIITYILREDFKDDNIEELIERVQNETIKIVGGDFPEDNPKNFRWHTSERELDELELDEPSSIGYTYKCLASGFYGLRSTRDFPETLNDLIRYGGDADTNGAVCGTMYGTRHGYRKLPYEWLRKMPNKKWLDLKIIDCLKKMNLIST